MLEGVSSFDLIQSLSGKICRISILEFLFVKCNLPIDVNLIIYISYIIDFFFYNLVSIRVQVALNISLHKFIYFISNFFFVTI